MKRILSIDVESDGLWGNPFAIAAIIYSEQGEELDKVVYRLPDRYITNPWVKENVLPTLENISVTHQSYEDMVLDFSKWYMTNKEDVTVLYHMGFIVEAHLFREMHRLGGIGDWDAPYTPIEVSEVLRQKGFKPDSVDSYVDKHNLKISDYGSTHNPLYDCEVAAKVYFHLVK